MLQIIMTMMLIYVTEVSLHALFIDYLRWECNLFFVSNVRYQVRYQVKDVFKDVSEELKKAKKKSHSKRMDTKQYYRYEKKDNNELVNGCLTVSDRSSLTESTLFPGCNSHFQQGALCGLLRHEYFSILNYCTHLRNWQLGASTVSPQKSIVIRVICHLSCVWDSHYSQVQQSVCVDACVSCTQISLLTWEQEWVE